MGGEEPGGEEQRRAPRSNLFLAATIEAAGVNASVRIRNLSATGAQLECSDFPPIGTWVRLKRQQVEIAAEIVWIALPRAGVRFRGTISVPDWIAGKESEPKFGQSRIDAIQAAVRSGEVPEASETSAAGDISAIPLDERLAEEVAHVRRLLEDVSETLIGDSAVVERHAEVLQTFDIVDQILGHLARIMTAEDREAAARAVGMAELRARLLRKAN